jgi:hypothetical protein
VKLVSFATFPLVEEAPVAAFFALVEPAPIIESLPCLDDALDDESPLAATPPLVVLPTCFLTSSFVEDFRVDDLIELPKFLDYRSWLLSIELPLDAPLVVFPPVADAFDTMLAFRLFYILLPTGVLDLVRSAPMTGCFEPALGVVIVFDGGTVVLAVVLPAVAPAAFPTGFTFFSSSVNFLSISTKAYLRSIISASFSFYF